MLHASRVAPAGRWTVPAATFAVWLLAALSLAYWGLRISQSSGSVSAVPDAVRQSEPADPVQIGRLLGAVPAAATEQATAPSLASRFQLTGVVAGVSGAGAALLSVDGRPPKPFAVGSRVEEGLVLQSVRGRQATLGPDRRGPASLTLEVPALPR